MKKVLVFGGTHGNEWTGIYAIKNCEEKFKNRFSNLELQFIHANPEAFELNKRFKDEDLNRAFQFLHENHPNSYEHNRAKELKALIDHSPCFVLDLHTTTSNMGNTIIISHPNQLNFFVASALAKKLPDTRVILSPDPKRKYLASQSEFGMMIEVGPVANNVLSDVTLSGTINLIEATLLTLSTLTNLTSGSLEIYEEVEDIHYPLNDKGDMTAIIHEGFQGKDFCELEGSYTPFKTFDGKDISLTTAEKRYPIFINEAAYYRTKLAFTLCKKRILKF